ncbi:MAG: efflux RND transporter permease subunit [Nitrospira sp.]|nr:efflux RND transporter permease subunit [Nitrospira sp.]
MSGVGLVSISGGSAVRIRANPRALAAYGLTLEDLRTVVAANVDEGQVRWPAALSIINATDQLFSSKEYRALIVAYRNGARSSLGGRGGPRRRGELQTDRLDGQDAGSDRQHPASAERERDRGGRCRVKALLPQLQRPYPLRCRCRC